MCEERERERVLRSKRWWGRQSIRKIEVGNDNDQYDKDDVVDGWDG